MTDRGGMARHSLARELHRRRVREPRDLIPLRGVDRVERRDRRGLLTAADVGAHDAVVLLALAAVAPEGERLPKARSSLCKLDKEDVLKKSLSAKIR